MNYAYDVQKAEDVLWDFYRISKIKTVLYDSNFETITAVPREECSFCTAMSQNPTALDLCHKCTLDSLQQCRQQRREIVYHCHAGLVEAVAPIEMDDIIVGYIMLGQVLEAQSDRDGIAQYAQKWIGTQARALLDTLFAKSNAEISAAVRLMQSCVCYLLMHKLIAEQHGDLLLQLRDYVAQHPTADLSVDALCRRFSLSRNALYKLSRTYFGMPIAAYVRQKRLAYAQQLIQNGVGVSVASEKAGFYDYGYFGKVFKKHLGKTPTKAKRR